MINFPLRNIPVFINMLCMYTNAVLEEKFAARPVPAEVCIHKMSLWSAATYYKGLIHMSLRDSNANHLNSAHF